MNRDISANDLLALLIEIAALALVVRLCLSFKSLGGWRWPLAGLALAGTVGLWALFFSPTAAHHLDMPWLFWGKLVMLTLPGLAFLRDGRPGLSLGWAALVLLHLLIGAAQKSL